MSGLIPAHAGKTRCRIGSRTSRAAHPRSRGENRLWELMEISDQGSSPLTRGKLGEHRDASDPRRLIPAHAGKTSFVVSIGSCAEAHPRSRGENPPTSR